jgi:hypothetical protein
VGCDGSWRYYQAAQQAVVTVAEGLGRQIASVPRLRLMRYLRRSSLRRRKVAGSIPTVKTGSHAHGCHTVESWFKRANRNTTKSEQGPTNAGSGWYRYKIGCWLIGLEFRVRISALGALRNEGDLLTVQEEILAEFEKKRHNVICFLFRHLHSLCWGYHSL